MSLAGFQPQHTGFQGGHTGFQQTFFSGGSVGGKSAKERDDYNQAFAEVYSRYENKNHSQVENIPEKVIRVIKKVSKVDNTDKLREKELRLELKTLELRYRREWLKMANDLHDAMLEQELKDAFAEQRAAQRREDDEMILLLLM